MSPLEFDHGYQSPYSWRYGTAEMRRVWGERRKRELWRQIWVWLAEVQADYGLVSQRQLAELREHCCQVDIRRSLEIEERIQHDLVAELKAFAAQCPQAGGVLHLGATSMDVKDNAAALQIKESLGLINQKTAAVLNSWKDLIQQYADTPVIAFTHLQPAEPTTLGYRLAHYAQDLLAGYQTLREIESSWKGKGFTGAVGTSASFQDLIGAENLNSFQGKLAEKLGISFYPVVSQTYPRSQEYRLLSELSGLGAVLYKFAFDLRFLQTPPVAEWSEPFGSQQVGSSAMPFKRNPIQSEKMDSLGRLLAQLPRVAWDNAAHSLLERTLDDSANRRTILPEGFLMLDEMLSITHRLLEGMEFYPAGMTANLEKYGPFAGTERVLMALVKKGADRQEMHERIRKISLKAWEIVQAGKENPLPELLSEDLEIAELLPPGRIRELLNVRQYLGDAPRRARDLARMIEESEVG